LSAAQAGIQVGDTLLKVGDTDLSSAPADGAIGVAGVIRSLDPGTQVTVQWQPSDGGPARTATLTVAQLATF